jgi:hypothetical protein
MRSTLAPQVLGYLLNHPVAALFVGGGLAVVVPRLVRFSVRFILVPAGVALLLYLAARNPGFVWGGVSSTASGDSPQGVGFIQDVELKFELVQLRQLRQQSTRPRAWRAGA